MIMTTNKHNKLQQVTTQVSDDEANELFIPVAPYLNLVFVIRGGTNVEFEALLKCYEKKHPFVPKNYYRKPRPELDKSKLGSAGFDQEYNLDHVLKPPREKAITRLFSRPTTKKKKRQRQENDAIKVHPPPENGKECWFEIREENAGYLILANLILLQQWNSLNLLFTNFLPESIQSIRNKPEWGNIIESQLKYQCVVRIFDFLNSIFLHVHSLATRTWNAVKHCPNMSKPQLWESLVADGTKSNWFRYGCYLRQYAVQFGYLDGTLLSLM